MPSNAQVIDCPVRGVKVPVLACHSCSNCLRVLFRSEFPPELQCMAWRRRIDPMAREEEGGKRVQTVLMPDRPSGQGASASLDATWPWTLPPSRESL